MHFDKVGFIGLGLIGGSIARKMKENNPKVSIIATAGHQQTTEDAFGLGLIDNNELLELNSFKDCDVIFLCAPVNKNIEYLRRFWAKQKIFRQGKWGLCFLPEVVYNKIVVS